MTLAEELQSLMTLAEELQSLFDSHLTDLGPTITGPSKEGTIQIAWETTNDGHPSVLFELTDTGNDEDDGAKVYDLDIQVGNNDNVGPKEMVAQTMRCLQQFYEMGLNTRFGRIVGTELRESPVGLSDAAGRVLGPAQRPTQRPSPGLDH